MNRPGIIRGILSAWSPVRTIAVILALPFFDGPPLAYAHWLSLMWLACPGLFPAVAGLASMAGLLAWPGFRSLSILCLGLDLLLGCTATAARLVELYSFMQQTLEPLTSPSILHIGLISGILAATILFLLILYYDGSRSEEA